METAVVNPVEHLRLQRWIVSIAAPFSILFLSWWLYVEYCWQSAVVLAAFCLTAASWIYAITLTKAGRIEASMTVFVVSLVTCESLTMALYHGLSGVAILADTVVIIYASLFAGRTLYYGTAGVIASVALSEYLKYLAIYDVKSFTRGQEAVFMTVFALLILPTIALLLRVIYRMQRDLLIATERLNAKQRAIISAAGHTGSVLEGVIRQLKAASDAFVEGAGQQAASIKEINQAMEQVSGIAGDTASSAKTTHLFSSRVQEKADTGKARLKEMSDGFGQVVETSEVFSIEFAELAKEAESIEDVLAANREIAGQIKILAVNASIQAAKAGKYGSGFRVVASELKSMIMRTEASLEQSTRLLEQIRNRARHSADTVQKATALQRDQLEKLNATKWLIDEMSGAFASTAKRFEAIADGSLAQQQRLLKVGSGIDHIDLAAGELSASTEILTGVVDEIVEANRKLQELLSSYHD